VTETLRSQNPAALIVPARYGIPVERTDLDRSAPVAAPAAEPEEATERPRSPETVALGLESWSAPLPDDLDLDRLRDALARMTGNAFGQVMRVKGIAPTGKGWVRFDVAGGRSSITAHVAQSDESPRVLAIGLALDREGLARAFQGCAMGDAVLVQSVALGLKVHPPGCGCADHAAGFDCAEVPAVAAE
jgi:G3E family GTPase